MPDTPASAAPHGSLSTKEPRPPTPGATWGPRIPLSTGVRTRDLGQAARQAATDAARLTGAAGPERTPAGTSAETRLGPPAHPCSSASSARLLVCKLNVRFRFPILGSIAHSDARRTAHNCTLPR